MRTLTLTANLLAETTCTYAAWLEGGTFRAAEEFFQVGGKGINVSHMLRRLGDETEALFFPGGANGARCERWLRAKGIPIRPFPTSAETRAGWVVRAPGRGETTFLGCDNTVDPESISACASHLNNQPAGTCLSVSGSIPAWSAPSWEPLRRALQTWLPGRSLVVDTYGEPLAWLAKLSCALVKVNRKEFSGLAGIAYEEATDARMPGLLADISARHTVARWVITDGPGAVWFVERGRAVDQADPPKIKEVSPTGSGDVLLACLIHACLLQGRDLRAGLEFALPMAAANAASPGVVDFDLAPFGFGTRG